MTECFYCFGNTRDHSIMLTLSNDELGNLGMKVISFNINGLRARPHQLEAVIEKYQPDVLGLQEIKVADEMFPYELVEHLGYHVFIMVKRDTTVLRC